jgi:hypothetical protein
MSVILTETPSETMATAMAADAMERKGLTKKEIAADHPTWCPGCGDFSVLALYFKLIEKRKLWHEKITTVAGIGCSSRFPYFVQAHGVHFIHGRALSFASGVSLSRPDLHVFVFGGDGDAFLDRRQSFHAHGAEEHQDDLRGHGQLGLRADQETNLPHLSARIQEQDRPLGRHRPAD